MQVSLAKYLVLLLRNRILNLGYYSVVTDHPINLQLNANIDRHNKQCDYRETNTEVSASNVQHMYKKL